MPLKTWAAYERLEAVDLNAAFAWSQDRTVPGAYGLVAGADTTGVAGIYVRMPLGAPAAGGDPLNCWGVLGDGRLYTTGAAGAGLWMFTASGACNTVTAGAGFNIHVTGAAMAGNRYTIGGGVDAVGSSAVWNATWVGYLTAGGDFYPQIRGINTDYSSGLVYTWSFLRLGRNIGGVGLPLGDRLEPLPAPDETPEPKGTPE